MKRERLVELGMVVGGFVLVGVLSIQGFGWTQGLLLTVASYLTVLYGFDLIPFWKTAR